MGSKLHGGAHRREHRGNVAMLNKLLFVSSCRPTHHSTGPTQKAAQADEFRR